MTNTATISLTNAHGLFAGIDPTVLHRAMIATANRSLPLLRAQAAGCTGFPEVEVGAPTPYDDCTWIEVLIIWIESGNHTF
jgi:hypothetical protein